MVTEKLKSLKITAASCEIAPVCPVGDSHPATMAWTYDDELITLSCDDKAHHPRLTLV